MTLAQHLDLIKYNKKGHLKSALKPISYEVIKAVHIIYPESYVLIRFIQEHGCITVQFYIDCP